MNNIIFKKERPFHEIELPNYPGSVVKMYKKPTLGEQRKLMAKHKNIGTDTSESMAYMCELLSILVYDWNFVDENDKKIPVSQEIIESMQEDDYMTLMAMYNGQTLTEYREDIEKKMTEKKKQKD